MDDSAGHAGGDGESAGALRRDVFPAPGEFVPERFVEEPRLERFLLAFSRGSRRCVGMNLAYAELYLAVARIFRRFGSRDVRGGG